MKRSKKYLTSVLLPLAMIGQPAFADCAGNGSVFHIKEGVNSCINVGQGHKVVHCIVSGLQQNAHLLITSSSFESNSVYFITRFAIPINHNNQRITFSGVGTQGNAEIDFAYFGPWDPSYSYDLTCTW